MKYILALFFTLVLVGVPAFAAEHAEMAQGAIQPSAAPPSAAPPKTAFDVNGYFDRSAFSSPYGEIEVKSVVALEVPPAIGSVAKPEQAAAALQPGSQPAMPVVPIPEPSLVKIASKYDLAKQMGTATDIDPIVADPNAPQSFHDMIGALNSNDWVKARSSAERFVKWINKLMLRVRQVTYLVGEAMVETGQISEENWIESYNLLRYYYADVYNDENFPFKPKQEDVLELIKPDPKQQVQIYYFFTLNSSYSRQMASDIERIWRVVKGDPRLRMVALTMGPEDKEWVASYRQHTGLTVPIYEGRALADKFRVRFVPSLVVVTSNSKNAYVSTGTQSFQSMYEIVRSAQGLPTIATPELQRLAATPIGFVESAQSQRGQFVPASFVTKSDGAAATNAGQQRAGNTQQSGKVVPISNRVTSDVTIERF